VNSQQNTSSVSQLHLYYFGTIPPKADILIYNYRRHFAKLQQLERIISFISVFLMN